MRRKRNQIQVLPNLNTHPERSCMDINRTGSAGGGSGYQLRRPPGTNECRHRIIAGKVHALIGPNGAGKTTLVNCITGAYKPDHGSILISGKSIWG